MPRTPANHSAVAEAGLVEGQPPFRSIWWVNAWATVIAVGFYRLSSMATSDFLLTDVTWDALLAVLSLLEGAVVGSIGTAIFFLTKRRLLRTRRSPRVAFLWLGLPALVPALLLVAYAGWKCLPSQRLKTICNGHAVRASDIRVVGATGMQVAEWLATFTVQPPDFQRLAVQLGLEPIPAEDFIGRREKLYMLRRKPLAAEWPTVESTNLQCFRWTHTGVDGTQHGDIHACFDRGTSRALVLSSGY